MSMRRTGEMVWISQDKEKCAMKCPKCGSKNVVGTNKARHALAWIVSAVVALALAPFVRNAAKGIALQILRQICPRVEYICVDCKTTFSEQIG